MFCNRWCRGLKKALRICCFSIVLAILAGDLAAADANDLVGWWKFDQQVPAVVHDYSGLANDGSISGNPLWRTWQIGGALEYLYQGDFVSIANESTFDLTEQFSITAWVKFGSEAVIDQQIISKGQAYCLHRNYDIGTIVFYTEGSRSVAGVTDIQDDKWHHVAAVFDGAMKYLYIDGNPDGSRSTTAVITNDYQLRIGSNEEIPGTDWRGLIGEVKVYNIALSESEISEMANEYFGFAYKPTPADGENISPDELTFSWEADGDINSYDIYLGTDFNDVNDANVFDTSGLYQGNVEDCSFTLPGFEFDNWHYWRVDTVKDTNICKGFTWSFYVQCVGDYIAGDVNGDCVVDLRDIAIFAEQWSQQ